MIFYQPKERDRRLFPHDPFKGMIVPRPIGWVSTRSKAGQLNLAPYSYFNGFSSWPQIVGFASESEKDSLTFACETGEFVWSMATYALRDQMNATSAGLPRGVSEFEHAGLATAPSALVAPPRVAASPASLECKVTQVLKLTDIAGKATGGTVVFGEVIGVHIDERFMKNGRFDLAAVQPIARCGYDEYAVVDKVFSLKRPESGGNSFGGPPAR
jgi:flavin reductase (DIM6/NTAB) family NADH-FMN oxidoreductase RutF